MTILEFLEIAGRYNILISCITKPISAYFVYLGIITVKKCNAEGKDDRRLKLGALMIVVGILGLAL